jgi:hypothetical protein
MLHRIKALVRSFARLFQQQPAPQPQPQEFTHHTYVGTHTLGDVQYPLYRATDKSSQLCVLAGTTFVPVSAFKR